MTTRTHAPETVAATQAIVRDARKNGSTLLATGRRTWPGAGGWTRHADALVATTSLDRLDHYEPADLTLTAGAGMGINRLTEIVEAHGQRLPFDSPGCCDGTLGAAVASGASGPLQTHYGASRDNVLGLEVVTGDARILRIGGRVVKNVAGYDLVRLFTGSRGSLGIITRVSIRLFPRPETDRTLVFGGDWAELATKARIAYASGIPLASAELMEGEEADVDRAAALTIRLLGGREQVEESTARTVAALNSKPGAVLRSGESRGLHARRIGWEHGASLVVGLTALPDRLGDALDVAQPIAEQLDPGGPGPSGSDSSGAITADVMQGSVRVKGSCGDEAGDGLVETLLQARRDMETLGGALVLSDGPADVADRVGWTAPAPGTAALANRIKDLFDPHRVLASRCP